jgi:hypothetical protein
MMDTLALLALALLAAGLLTGLVSLLLRKFGVAPARPEERARGIELLVERLREHFQKRY